MVRPGRLTAAWISLGLLVAAFGFFLALASVRFGYAYEVEEMPVTALVTGLVAAGLLFWLTLPPLIRATSHAANAGSRLFLMVIVAAGLAARLALFASEPILEDDYQRYLWDGAVTAHGLDPYTVAPITARQLPTDTELGRLAAEAGPIARRINHPELTSVYPPVAQASFAIAHLIAPWSLTGWRALLLGADLATLALILALLGMSGRSPLWVALYWWNPLVIKELFNSAHMDAIVLPLVLLALLLAARARQIAAGASIALAAGAKIWPVLLLPLVLRPLATRPRALAAAMLIIGALLVVLAAPIVMSGLGTNSGFTAYATHWQTSSALFPVLEGACAALFANIGDAGLMARLAVAIVVAAIACGFSIKPVSDTDDLMGRASLIVAALVLLSPAQFPWYAVWYAPFLAFRPWSGFLVLTATAPLYYMSFHLTASGEADLFRHYIVWLIWIPVWVALAIEAVRYRSRRRA